MIEVIVIIATVVVGGLLAYVDTKTNGKLR